MKRYCTEVRAIKPGTGELTTYCGPEVPGLTLAHAEQYCQDNGLGYCRVLGELIAEIPTKADGLTPDWDGMIDYEAPGLN
jgi:hypothetical protein